MKLFLPELSCVRREAGQAQHPLGDLHVAILLILPFVDVVGAAVRVEGIPPAD